MENNIVVLQLQKLLKDNKDLIDNSDLCFMDIHGIITDPYNQIIGTYPAAIRPIVDELRKILKDTSLYYEIDFNYFQIMVYKQEYTLEVKND